MPAGRFARRTFLHGSGLAVGSGILLGACGSGDKPDSKTTTQPTTTLGGSATEGDIALLNSTLDVENRGIAAYTVLTERLSGRARATAERFGEQEREHARRITEAIEDLGGTPNAAKEPGDHGFPDLDDQEAALEFAVAVENDAIAWYIDAVPKYSTPDMRATAASIVTVEAEQLTVLLGLQDRPQVVEAFVLGRRL